MFTGECIFSLVNVCSSCELSILCQERDALARAMECQLSGPGLESCGVMSNWGQLSLFILYCSSSVSVK